MNALKQVAWRISNHRGMMYLTDNEDWACFCAAHGLIVEGLSLTRQPPFQINDTMKRTYLCGPINGCTDEECKDWRQYVAGILPDTCDPMVRDYRGREAECFAEIVELDKQDIDGCDFILVNYDKPSVGTAMEILYAWERKKPVITVCKEGTSISPWLRYHSTLICHSFDEAIKHIQAA